jgi:hypothetical protein
MAKRGLPENAATVDGDVRDRYPRVDREHAGLVCQHRSEVDFVNFGEVGHQLRKLDQEKLDRALIGRRHVAIGLEDVRHARARDQLSCQIEIERRQR